MTIVSEIREEGLEAVRRWALELDGAEPARAEPDDEGLPGEALLELADRVRRWHAAQRPADVELAVASAVLDVAIRECGLSAVEASAALGRRRPGPDG